MIKKIVLDKADRIYHFPFDVEEFFPRRALAGETKEPIIDLGHFRWPQKDSGELSNKISGQAASSDDLLRLKETIAGWLEKEYKIQTDPRKEIYIGQGIHRIIFDFCLAFIEYGDIVLCPEPGMTFYRRSVISSGGVPVSYSISSKTSYKPSFSRLPDHLGKSAKVLILNSPHNPTGTMLDDHELADLVRAAAKQNMFIINDAAFCSLAEAKHPLLRTVPGGRKVGLEIFSFAFTFGLGYMPFGFAVGPPEIINGLEIAGKTIGGFFPKFWIDQTVEAIKKYPSAGMNEIRKNIGLSRQKAEQLVEKMGWESVGGKSSPFIWAIIPERKGSSAYAATILRRRRVLTLPGIALGETGEGFLRLSLTASPQDYAEAIVRFSRKLQLRSKSGD
jgi:LL-diaminopimelate aminotransferase